MDIPIIFYIVFWIRNSCLASATCFMLLILIPPLFALVPWAWIVGCAAYQIFMYRYFFGDRRGDLEYIYRSHIIDSTFRRTIVRTYGYFVLLRYLLNQMGEISPFNEEFFQKLLKESSGSIDGDSHFTVYVKLAEFCHKNGLHDKEKLYLESALEEKPADLVAHFKAAVASERLGDSSSAMEHDASALQDPSSASEQLRNFITAQISHVATSGPRKKPPIPGLKFLTW